MPEPRYGYVPLPAYPFDWHPDARFAAVKAAQDVLDEHCNPCSVNAVDDAIEAGVKAYNAALAADQPGPDSLETPPGRPTP